jgi:hypothetical protein
MAQLFMGVPIYYAGIRRQFEENHGATGSDPDTG